MVAEKKEERGLSLALYDRVQDPMLAISQMGRAMALSGWMGCDNEGAGQVLAMECFAQRMTPLALKRRYHITKFGLMDQAASVLADFRRAGGKVKELSRTPDLAHAVLSFDGEQYEVRLSWEDAQKEPFPYEGKEKEVLALLASKKRPILKAKYSTPKSREQMLWWRLIKDTINAHWPELTSGVPSVEEHGETADYLDETDDPSIVNGEFEVKADPNPVTKEQYDKSIKELAEKFPEPEPAKPDPAKVEPTKSAEPEYCTAEQSESIRLRVEQLALTPEQLTKAIAKRGGSGGTLRTLTREAAAELLSTLDATIAKRGPAKDAPSEEVIPLGPCTPEQIKEVLALSTELQQIKPGSIEKFTEKLRSEGKTGIAQLSQRDCAALIDDLKRRTMDNFFQRSLESWEPPKN